MNICVVGTGYVGLVSGVCFSDLGNYVTCVDLDEKKIEILKQGKSPIYEPGIEELIKKNSHENRLFFTTDLESAMEDAQIIIIAVGTPRKVNGEADLTYIEKVAESIGRYIKEYKVVVTKSTVPVGTGKIVKELIAQHANGVQFDVASNPEFLREGSAIYDTLNMERAVIGVESEQAAKLLTELHKPLTNNIVRTNIETAEMIKYASNAFLATKISFINEIANLCELLGADVTKVAEGMGYDKRIGKAFLQAGIGYGGSCFPKDTSALVAIAEQAGYNFRIVKDVEQVNKEQRYKVIDKLRVALHNDLHGKKIAVLGLAFKPNTDDMRDAPSVDIIPILQHEGADVVAYDPVANNHAQRIIPNLQVADTKEEAIINSDAILILTDWKEFKEMDLAKVAKLVKQKIIVDGRNMFSVEEMEEAAFYYASIGRRTANSN